jgi:hypothetical protein
LRAIRRYAHGVDFAQTIIMLRRTNRLKQLLAPHGLELLLCNDLGGEVIPPSGIVEAECSQGRQSQLTQLSGLFELLTTRIVGQNKLVLKKIVRQ